MRAMAKSASLPRRLLLLETAGVERQMEDYGVLIGTALLLIVSAAALLLGRKANAQVKQFREEQHERFRGRANHE